ncbi:MAG: hypothetical protein IJX46_06705, partial [Clostridia bacterium]|nr:hypothetical protein [Clostridia bacterium]
KNAQSNKKEPLFPSRPDGKSGFSVEILTDFNFYVRFLDALGLSGVRPYADENPITPSASK